MAKKSARPEVEVLQDAYEYQTTDVKRDIEKALRAIAFLLDYASNLGNQSISAQAAAGLAEITRQVAGDVRDYLKGPNKYVTRGGQIVPGEER